MRTELRPLDLGQILDRTFQIYRSNFLLFAGLAAVGAAASLVWSAIQTIILRTFQAHGHSQPQILVLTYALMPIAIGIALVAFSLVGGAIVQTVAAIYLDQPTGVERALRTVQPRWFKLLLVTLTAFLLPWLPVMAGFAGIAAVGAFAKSIGNAGAATILAITGLIGLSFLAFVPIGIWLSLRYALSNAVSAYEKTTLRQSLKRSALLGKGMRGRLFLLLLVALILQMVVGSMLTIPMWVALIRNPLHPPLWATIYGIIAGFFSSAFTTPIPAIGIALFYFDARIRKEGLDIEWSLQSASQPDGATMPSLPQPDPSAG